MDLPDVFSEKLKEKTGHRLRMIPQEGPLAEAIEAIGLGPSDLFRRSRPIEMVSLNDAALLRTGGDLLYFFGLTIL